MKYLLLWKRLNRWNSLIFLTLLLILGSIGAGFFVQQNLLIKQFDDYFYVLIHMSPHSSILDKIIIPFNFNFLPGYLSPFHMPSYFYFMVLGTLFYIVIYKRPETKWVLISFIFGTILSQLITAVDWQIVFRQRPFVFLPNQVTDFGKLAWTNWTSYPSGHVRDTILYSVIIYHYIPKLKWPLLIFTAFLSYSRIYLGAHYPTDVIAGLIIGYLAAKIALAATQEFKALKLGGKVESKIRKAAA